MTDPPTTPPGAPRTPAIVALEAAGVPFRVVQTAIARSAEESAELQKKLSNPISDLVSVPFQFNWEQGVGPNEQTRFILNVQPVMPFALNESTRFISPTKTPEYLAAGKPVVSTPVRDVARTYGAIDLVRIADTPESFVAALEAELERSRAPGAWLEEVDTLLAGMSWDQTWIRMKELLA